MSCTHEKELARVLRIVRDAPCPFSACCAVYPTHDWKDETRRLWCWRARALRLDREEAPDAEVSPPATMGD